MRTAIIEFLLWVMIAINSFTLYQNTKVRDQNNELIKISKEALKGE